MPKYIAFLRAINVGGHTVKMDSLRLLFEALGFSNVETFIASGNVIFNSSSRSSKTLERQIENYLQTQLGYPVATFVRTTAELTAAARRNPFDTAELEAEGNSVVYIAFLADTPSDEARLKLLSFSTEDDTFHLAGREGLLAVPEKVQRIQFFRGTAGKNSGSARDLAQCNYC